MELQQLPGGEWVWECPVCNEGEIRANYEKDLAAEHMDNHECPVVVVEAEEIKEDDPELADLFAATPHPPVADLFPPVEETEDDKPFK